MPYCTYLCCSLVLSYQSPHFIHTLYPLVLPQELSSSLWAIAKLGHNPGKVFLRAAEAKLLGRLLFLQPVDVANALWAFGRMHYQPVELLDELPLHIARRLMDFQPRDISCVLFGYTQARHYHAALLDALAPVS